MNVILKSIYPCSEGRVKTGVLETVGCSIPSPTANWYSGPDGWPMVLLVSKAIVVIAPGTLGL